MIIKGLIILFTVFALYWVFLRYRKEEITTFEFSGWFVFWVLVAIATLWHRTTDLIAKYLGVERGADLLVYISVIVLFFLMFKLFVKLEKIEKNITTIVRNVALSESKGEKEKSE